MAIQDDWLIDYANKIAYYNGGFTNGIPNSTYTANALYSYLMDTFDEPAQMDDLVPMEGKTPTAYELINRWFTDPTSVKSLYGGAIATNGWAFSATADIDGHYGITELYYDGDGSPTQGNDGYTDKGIVLTGAPSGATGTILWVDNANDRIWVRNTSSTQFANSDTVTGTGWNVDLNASGGFASGEQLWTNLYTLGTFASETDIYIYQGNPGDTYDATPNKLTPWWNDGQIDVLILCKVHGNFLDSGLVTVYARQYSILYSHFVTDLSGGGRQPAPLSAGNDLNNATGYRTSATTGSSGTFQVGEMFDDDSTGLKQGIVTAVTGSNPTVTIRYYLVGKDLTDFSNGDAVTGTVSGAQATMGTPANYGPALLTDVTIAFGARTIDIGNGNGLRKYSMEIDPSDNPIEEVYERLKYITRRGSTEQLGTGSSYDENGEAYIGNVVRLQATETTAWTEGQLLTGQSSGATGVIVAYHDDGGSGQLILCQVRGTFSTETVNDEGSGTGTVTAVTTIAPVPASPFGTFAGGKFFGAPGVGLTIANLASGDEQAYQLIDDLGVTQVPPNTVSMAVTGLKDDDRVGVFRLAAAGQPIDKDIYSGTVQSAGAGTVVIGESIGSDEPSAGVVRIVDQSEVELPEARLRYASWATSTFTLAAGVSGQAEGGSSGNTLIDTGVFGSNIEVGDSIRNTSTGAWGYVVEIVDADEITTVSAPGETLSWTSGNNFETNKLPFDTTTSDDVYVAIIDKVRTSDGDETNQLIYSADIPVTVRVRSKGNSIKPFIVESSIVSTGREVAAIRLTDEIVS